MKTRLLLTFALALGTSSCIGSNAAYSNVHHWNSRLFDNKYLNEAVFLGLNFIPPVYPFALLGDYIIFNPIEFWSGNNVLPEPPGYADQNALDDADVIADIKKD